MIIKAIGGFPGYFVTDTGKIFSTKKTFQEIRPQLDRYGYHHFSARRNGRSVTVRVHHAVATAFHGPKPEGLVGAHMDGNKSNNCFDNIQWVTVEVNNSHKIKHGTVAKGSKINTSRLKEHQIPAIRRLLSQGASLKEISDIFGVACGTINSIKTGATWKHVPCAIGGYQ